MQHENSFDCFFWGGEQSKDVAKSNVLQYYLNTVGRRTLSSGI